MEHKFLNRTKKVSLSQINLKEFFEFYKNFICCYRYNYILEDKTELSIIFEENTFAHLIGLHKFKRISFYKKSSDINSDILNGNHLLKNYLH